MSLAHGRPKEFRKPDCKILPDGRKRLTRYREFNHGHELKDSLIQDWGAVDVGPATGETAGFAGLRLVDQYLDGEYGRRASATPVWVEVYETLPATAEQLVGRPTKIVLEDGRDAWEYNYLQFTAGSFAPGTVGSSTAPDNSGLYLQRVEAPDNGCLRQIKRIYVESGILATDTQTRQGGKAMVKRITSAKTVPSTPSGYILIGEPVQNPNGLPVYTYTYAKGEGLVDEVKESAPIGLRRVTWVSLGTREVPDGVVVRDAYREDDGYKVYTVTTMQNADGGADPTSGSHSVERYRDFTYPGRAKAYSETINGFKLLGLFQDPPVTAKVVHTYTISYVTSPVLGTITDLWNPVQWACARAQWVGLGPEPADLIRPLPGYRAVSSTPVTETASGFAPSDLSIFGNTVFGGEDATIVVDGGPEDPGGNSYTIDAWIDEQPAFSSVSGTAYYRKVVITADIPYAAFATGVSMDPTKPLTEEALRAQFQREHPFAGSGDSPDFEAIVAKSEERARARSAAPAPLPDLQVDIDQLWAAIRKLQAGSGGGGGGGGDIAAAFELYSIDSANVQVRAGAVNAVVSGGTGSNINVGSESDGTYNFFIDATIDAAGAVTSANVDYAGSMPSDSTYHAYLLIGTAVVTGGAVSEVTRFARLAKPWLFAAAIPETPSPRPAPTIGDFLMHFANAAAIAAKLTDSIVGLCCCGTAAPAECGCSLMAGVPVSHSDPNSVSFDPLESYELAKAAITGDYTGIDPFVTRYLQSNCIGWFQPFWGGYSSTYLFTASQPGPNQLSLFGGGSHDNGGTPPTTVNMQMWASITLADVADLSIVFTPADTGPVYVNLYNCGSGLFYAQALNNLVPSAPHGFTNVPAGEYILMVAAIGIANDGSSTGGVAITSSVAMLVNPVLVPYDDGGTTRVLEACPKMILPRIWEGGGNDWYADLAEATNRLSDYTANCFVYSGGIPFSGPQIALSASLAGGTISVHSQTSINVAVAQIAMFVEAGETVDVNYVVAAGSGSASTLVITARDMDGGILGQAVLSAPSSGTVTIPANPGPGAPPVIFPYSGKFYVEVMALIGGSGTTLDADITTTGAIDLYPIELLYDVGLACPARLGCS